MRECFKCKKKFGKRETYYFAVRKRRIGYTAVSIEKPIYYHEKCFERKEGI